ncbi:3-hydroxyisobutyrate dehydrogenase [Guyanagaster necrorhizus]|uniref:3-hydroxyisobutyrate dehydrogenase n=1 Tax=Guyanagaster necrorhizus TaxID=856835 RepID=A0A9P7W524_9AGAR|nr:3-hydroxyisobutyrate dehydrogenase [Guyanagaster necrorhizus MCA 3950]KAG7452818.1 3-hydroxyisobutyrate dehydrogenase [Guyanagaster necrorhizus MCA 3950]
MKSLRLLDPLSRMTLRSKSTAFVGLGRMGSEMAYNLFSKQQAQEGDSHFVVCDAVPERADLFCRDFLFKFPDAKIHTALTPDVAAMSSQTVITMLPSSPHVKQVYNESIIPGIRALPHNAIRDTFAIDSTTLDVSVAQQLASQLNDLGVQAVDAPVSGGVAGARAGALTFLVGGTEAAFDRSYSILSLMGQRIIHCGPSGAGLGAKICNNLMLGVQQIATAEAMLLGKRLGLDPVVLSSVIGSSTGNCWSMSVNNPVPKALPDLSPPCDRGYEGGFATSLMLKDMGLAADIGAQTGTPLPMGDAATQIYARMLQASPELATKDFSSVYKFLESKA